MYKYTAIDHFVAHEKVNFYGKILKIEKFDYNIVHMVLEDKSGSVLARIEGYDAKLEIGGIVRVHRAVAVRNRRVRIDIGKAGCHIVAWNPDEKNPGKPAYCSSKTWTRDKLDRIMLDELGKLGIAQEENDDQEPCCSTKPQQPVDQNQNEEEDDDVIIIEPEIPRGKGKKRNMTGNDQPGEIKRSKKSKFLRRNMDWKKVKKLRKALYPIVCQELLPLHKIAMDMISMCPATEEVDELETLKNLPAGRIFMSGNFYEMSPFCDESAEGLVQWVFECEKCVVFGFIGYISRGEHQKCSRCKVCSEMRNVKMAVRMRVEDREELFIYLTDAEKLDGLQYMIDIDKESAWEMKRAEYTRWCNEMRRALAAYLESRIVCASNSILTSRTRESQFYELYVSLPLITTSSESY